MAYSDSQKKDIKRKICEQLSVGESLVKVCKSKEMPTYSTVMLWLSEDTEFSDNYARARLDQADYIFDNCLDIADDVNATPESVAKARLQIDTRKWMAGKLRPKKYGDKLDIDHSGGISINVQKTFEKVTDNKSK